MNPWSNDATLRLDDVLSLPLWAKKCNHNTDGTCDLCGGSYHHTIAHCIDTGAVLEALWDKYLPDRVKEIFRQAFGCDDETAKKRMALHICIHDVGKISRSFQKRDFKSASLLENAGMDFANTRNNDDITPYHGQVTGVEFFDWGNARCDDDVYSAAICEGIGLAGHHGGFDKLGRDETLYAEGCGTSEWEDARWEAFDILKGLFYGGEDLIFAPVDDVVCHILMAGLTAVCDFIASNVSNFPMNPDATTDLDAYVEEARKRARAAVEKSGLMKSRDFVAGDLGEKMAVSDLFDFEKPNTLQACVDEAMDEWGLENEDMLFVIIEAPTGFGKTEAAFLIVRRMIEMMGVTGYITAMPTQATATAIGERILDFAEKCYERGQFQLAHGMAQAVEYYTDRLKGGVSSGLSSSRFLSQRLLSSLSTISCGTYDQLGMGVITSKHFPIRLLGMVQKAILIDEVHSYDAYSLSIIKGILGWARALHSPTIMLSATMPTFIRNDLINTCTGGDTKEFKDMPPPRITGITMDGEVRVKNFDLPEWAEKEWELRPLPPDRREQIRVIIDQLAGPEGGNAIWFSNTVSGARELARQIRNYCDEIGIDIVVDIAHSQYKVRDRTAKEDDLKEKYGKNAPRRPHRSITIATQVAEQSLDIDFDLVITSIAPMDVLAQRLGRGHRHIRDDDEKQRPSNLNEPVVYVESPGEDEGGEPDFGNDTYVYDHHLLRRTLQVLQHKIDHRGVLSFPDDVQELLDDVYDLSPIENLKGKDKATRKKLDDKRKNMGQKAYEITIFGPDTKMWFDKAVTTAKCDSGVDDGPFEARTRYNQQPTTSMVIVRMIDGIPHYVVDADDAKNRDNAHFIDDRYWLPLGHEDEMGDWVNLSLDYKAEWDELPEKFVRSMIFNSTTSNSYYVAEYFLPKDKSNLAREAETPKLWERVPMLKFFKVARFDENGHFRPDGLDPTDKKYFEMIDDPETGIEIIRDK